MSTWKAELVANSFEEAFRGDPTFVQGTATGLRTLMGEVKDGASSSRLPVFVEPSRATAEDPGMHAQRLLFLAQDMFSSRGNEAPAVQASRRHLAHVTHSSQSIQHHLSLCHRTTFLARILQIEPDMAFHHAMTCPHGPRPALSQTCTAAGPQDAPPDDDSLLLNGRPLLYFKACAFRGVHSHRGDESSAHASPAWMLREEQYCFLHQ